MLLPAQDWQWEWGRPDFNAFRTMTGIQSVGTDRMNRVYACYGYHDSLVLQDTIFRHASGQFTINNSVVLYRDDGTFFKAIDIFSVPMGNIWNTMMKSDTAGNLYIASEFQMQAYILDTVIYHGPAPFEQVPDIFILKLDPELNIEWIRLIWGTTQSTLVGFHIGEDQQVYLATSHYGNGSTNESVHFFNADSATFLRTLQCVMKLNTDGDLLWRKEIRTTNTLGHSRTFTYGSDGNLYHLSEAYGNYLIGDDTVAVPGSPPLALSIPCILKFSSGGSFQGGIMVNNGLMLSDIRADAEGNIFYSGYSTDTVILQNDTLVPGIDSALSVVGKTNPQFTSDWYQMVRYNYTQSYSFFHITPVGEDLFFAASFKKTFTFAGHTFQFGSITRPLIGKLLPGGILGEYILGNTSFEMLTNGLETDNCNNLLFNGMFRGTAYVGRDTLQGYFYSPFIGSIRLYPPDDPLLVTDTTVCNGIVLHASPGYRYYSWNGGLSMADTLRVTATGWYNLTVHNGHYCWANDSVFVAVTKMPSTVLRPDTTIFRKDSLILSLNTPYDRCFWSTGDTTSSILIRGSELGTGPHLFWVTVTRGPCTVTDSVRITVTWNPGITDALQDRLFFYPNPVDHVLVVRIQGGPVRMRVYFPDGRLAFSTERGAIHDELLQTDLSSLLPGLYLIEIISGDSRHYGKMIKK